MIPVDQRVPFASYRPGFACTVFGEYESLCAEAAGTRPLAPGTLPALYSLTHRHYRIVESRRAEIDAWLCAQTFSAQIISCIATRGPTDYADASPSGRFLSIESEEALVAFRMQWL